MTPLVAANRRIPDKDVVLSGFLVPAKVCDPTDFKLVNLNCDNAVEHRFLVDSFLISHHLPTPFSVVACKEELCCKAVVHTVIVNKGEWL